MRAYMCLLKTEGGAHVSLQDVVRLSPGCWIRPCLDAALCDNLVYGVLCKIVSIEFSTWGPGIAGMTLSSGMCSEVGPVAIFHGLSE